VQAYITNIAQNPCFGRHLCSLQFYDLFYTPPASTHQILSCSSQLTQVRCIRLADEDEDDYVWRFFLLTWANFEQLATAAGSTVIILQGIAIEDDPQRQFSPSIFGRFHHLRSLECRMTMRFTTDTYNTLSDYLPVIESLRIWHCDSSFLDVLSRMKYVVAFIVGRSPADRHVLA
jgi:hypothetical protein